MASKATGIAPAKPNKHMMHIELSAADLKGISIGDKVTARVTGTVKRMTAGEEGDKHWDGMPPEISLEVSKVNIEGDNEYSRMAEEDD